MSIWGRMKQVAKKKIFKITLYKWKNTLIYRLKDIRNVPKKSDIEWPLGHIPLNFTGLQKNK